MSFAGLMFHIASSQAFRFAQVAGVPSPLKLPEKLEKAELYLRVKGIKPPPYRF